MIYLPTFQREILDFIDDAWKTHPADIARAFDAPVSLLAGPLDDLTKLGFIERDSAGIREYRTTDAGKLWLAEWHASRRFKRIKRWARRVLVLGVIAAAAYGYWQLYQADQRRIAEHHCEQVVEKLIDAKVLEPDVEVSCS